MSLEAQNLEVNQQDPNVAGESGGQGVEQVDQPTTETQEEEPGESEEGGEGGGAPESQEGDNPPSSPPRGVQKRLSELTSERNEARKEAAELRQMLRETLEAMRAKPQGVQEQRQAVIEDPEPTEENFQGSWSELQKAREAWLERKITRQVEDRVVRNLADRHATQAVIQDGEAWLKEGEKIAPGFRQLVTRQPEEGGPRVTREMYDAMRDHPDASHKVAVYLAKNVAESERIASLPVRQQIREIDALVAKVKQSASKQTGAPPPVTPVGTRGAAPMPDFSKPGNMDEYRKWREAQKGK